MMITNLDTLSALFDRLISERIKLFFFAKDGDDEKAQHQEIVINEIKGRVANLLDECLKNGEYNYLAEKRTFKSSDIVEELEQLVVNDIVVGESDRGVLAEITSDEPDISSLMTHAKRMRKANEERSFNKNNIDNIMAELSQQKQKT